MFDKVIASHQKLFTLVLEDASKALNWQGKGINIQGKYLQNLRFADDIVMFASNGEKLTEMLEQLQEKSARVRLVINSTKTSS